MTSTRRSALLAALIAALVAGSVQAFHGAARLVSGLRLPRAPTVAPRWLSMNSDADASVSIGSAGVSEPELITEPFDSNAVSMRLVLGSETGEIGFLQWPQTETVNDFSSRYKEGDKVLVIEGTAICQISEFNDGVSNEPPFLVTPGCLLEFNEPCAMSWELEEPVKFLAPGLGELGQYAITTAAVVLVLLVLFVTQG